jgi:hypothetical protein
MFKFLFKIAEIANFTESELSAYEDSMKALNDYWAGIDYAVKTAVAKAEAKAARTEARAEARGVARGKFEDAQSMLAEGLDPALVARVTKLPRKQIMAMR